MLCNPNLTDGRQSSRSQHAASAGNGLEKAVGVRVQYHYLGPPHCLHSIVCLTPGSQSFCVFCSRTGFSIFTSTFVTFVAGHWIR